MKRYDIIETAYEYLGVHREDTDYIFRVFAPRADAVYLVGDFNKWNESNPMTLLDGGVWELAVSAQIIREGDLYKYKIKNGFKELYKADPYAFCTLPAPETASVVSDIFGYDWRDASWLEYRNNKKDTEPINIYKLHAPSFKSSDGELPFSWAQLARELSSYVKQMGYTHVELTSVIEHGDKTEAYYAPTARLGTPFEFMGFVDSMHEAGVGVILNWTPAYFANNEYSLSEFDGQPLYENENGLDGIRYFDFGRKEVKSFLMSNAHFWLNVYHVDGLRINDASIRILSESEREFCKELKSSIKKHFPNTLIIDKIERPLFDKFNGDPSQRSAFLRLSLGYQITFPCEKSLFMGMEIGQLFDSSNQSSIEWDLLENEENCKLQYYVAELNHFYLKTSPLWRSDGFERIEINDSDNGVMAYARTDDNGKELTVILNFTSEARRKFRIGVTKEGAYEEIFNSDDRRFGGSGMLNGGVIVSENVKYQKYSESIQLDVPPMSVVILRYV